MCGLTEIERQEFHKDRSKSNWYNRWLNYAIEHFLKEKFKKEEKSNLKSCVNDNLHN